MSGEPSALDRQKLDEQRSLVRRTRRDAYHWAFRAVLLAGISGLALRYGWTIFGVLFAVLALMGVGLARSMRRRAAQLEAQLKLLESGE